MSGRGHPAGAAAFLLAGALAGVVLLAGALVSCESSTSERPSAPGRPVLAPNGAPVPPVLIRVAPLPRGVCLEGDACVVPPEDDPEACEVIHLEACG